MLCGWAFSIIPKVYTFYGSVALFFVFGVKMIYDGLKMSPSEAQEEYDEVQQELRKREEEVNKNEILYIYELRITRGKQEQIVLKVLVL